MQVVDLPVRSIAPADWNPNHMGGLMVEKLRGSIRRFGWVVPLVVRELDPGRYETIGGAQRLGIAQELELDQVPCIVVAVDDTEARLLGQCLNRRSGEDDLGLKAELIRELLGSLPQEEVLKLLPETAESLSALASLGQQDMASHLMAWQEAQQARLNHMQFQLTTVQLVVVDEALARVMPEAKSAGGDNPNVRGTALYLLCKRILELEKETS